MTIRRGTMSLGFKRVASLGGMAEPLQWGGATTRGAVRTITETNYDLNLDDANAVMVLFDNASPVTARLRRDQDYAWSEGAVITVSQWGAGSLTVEADRGVTINTPETLVLAKRYAVASLVKEGPNEWTLVGYLQAA